MGNEHIDGLCAFFTQRVDCEGERVPGVDHVVDEDGDLVLDITHQELHLLRRVLASLALPVDQRKLDAKLVCDGCHPAQNARSFV